MARLSAAGENAATNAVTGISGFFSLNTADPGTTGASEAAVTRQAETWAASSAGQASNSTAMTVPITAATTIAGASHWSALTAGTFSIGDLLASSITFNGSGSVTVAVGADTVTSS